MRTIRILKIHIIIMNAKCVKNDNFLSPTEIAIRGSELLIAQLVERMTVVV